MEGKSNLSFILNKPLSVAFEDRPVPTLQSPHDVLVAVNYTGICGSDVHYWQHGAIGHFVVKDPMVLGHESAGTVVRVGDEVKTLKEGDRIALEPGYPCRRCGNCLAGKYNLCPDMKFAATPPYDGTLTGFWVAPADFCYKLPDNVSLQEGALIEPLAVGVHVVRQARVKPGDSVVVMGAGPVGLLCAAVARAFGASTVVSVDIVPSKLEFAEGFAATHTYLSQRVSAEENARNLLQRSGLPDGADIVIDASGAEPSIQAALHAVKVGGTYVQAGMGKPDITFPIMAFCLKEVTARGSFRYGAGDYKLAVELVATGKVDVKKLISQVVGFKQAEEAFNKVKEGQVLKILIAGPNEKVEGDAASHEAKSEVKTAAPAETQTPQAPEEKTAAPVGTGPESTHDRKAVNTESKADAQTQAAPSEQQTDAPVGSGPDSANPDTTQEHQPHEKKAEHVVPVAEQNQAGASDQQSAVKAPEQGVGDEVKQTEQPAAPQ